MVLSCNMTYTNPNIRLPMEMKQKCDISILKTFKYSEIKWEKYEK